MMKRELTHSLTHSLTCARQWFLSLLIVLCLFIIIGSSNQSANTPAISQSPPPKISVHFSPNGGCTEAIVNEIKQAKETIFVQAYSFTSESIALALIDAYYKRRIEVEIILDKIQSKGQGSKADTVAQAGIPTFIDSKHAIAHNKIMILDGKVLITGSFNFSKNAEERNAENLLIIKDQPELVKRYTEKYLECLTSTHLRVRNKEKQVVHSRSLGGETP